MGNTPADKSPRSVSIIIPTLNEERNIAPLFESIENQKLLPNILITDIIVVDNGSEDRTCEIAREYRAKILSKPNITIASLRNWGAKQSKGDILIFSDADNIFTEKTVNQIVATITSKDEIGAVSPGSPASGNCTWVEETWLFQIQKGFKQPTEVNLLGSGFIAIKRDVLKKVNYFDPELISGEDTDISDRIKKIGFKLILDENIIVYNTGYPKNLKDFIKREIWHGDTFKTLWAHKKLTVFFFITCISLFIPILSFFYEGIFFFTISPVFICLVIMPIFRSAQKVKKINLMSLRLIILYQVYILTRIFALFRRKEERKWWKADKML